METPNYGLRTNLSSLRAKLSGGLNPDGTPESGRDLAVWGWTALLGVFMIFMGLGVLGAAVVSTLAISWLVGLALIIGGIAQLLHTHRVGTLGDETIHFLGGILAIVAGGVILSNPVVGAVSITLVLGVYFIFSAFTKATIVFQSQRRGQKFGRGWLAVSSIISFVLGVTLLGTYPLTSLVVPGAILGIDLLLYGVVVMALANRLRTGEVQLEATPSLEDRIDEINRQKSA